MALSGKKLGRVITGNYGRDTAAGLGRACPRGQDPTVIGMAMYFNRFNDALRVEPTK